jgi:hypothetical protein
MASPHEYLSNEGTFLRVPEPKLDRRSHRCQLPATDYPLGTIWRCPCRRRWKLLGTSQETVMAASHPGTSRLAWVRRRLPWPRRSVADELTQSLESPQGPGELDFWTQLPQGPDS